MSGIKRPRGSKTRTIIAYHKWVIKSRLYYFDAEEDMEESSVYLRLKDNSQEVKIKDKDHEVIQNKWNYCSYATRF